MLIEKIVRRRSTNGLQIAQRSALAVDSPINCDCIELAVGVEASYRTPKVYYGWLMLALAMGLAIASSPGQTFGVSIFIEPMRLELGLSHAQMGLAYTLGTLFGAGPILWIGHQVDRRGLRRVALGGVIAFGLSCCLMGLVQNWLQTVFAFTFLRMLGPGALSLVSSNTLPFWFSRKLGTVEGFRQTAMAFAMATIPPLNLWLVFQFGWRLGYVILGGSILIIFGLAVWRWFRSHPNELGLNIDGIKASSIATRQARGQRDDSLPISDSPQSDQPRSFTISETIKTAPFWIVLAGTSLFGIIQTGVFFCLTPILREFSLDEGIAASMLAAFAISLAVHQMIGGRLADQFEAKWMLAMGMCLFAAGLGCMTMFRDSTGVLIAGCLLGAAQGIYSSSAQPLWARYYGTKHLGKLRGMLMATNVAASSIGPFLVGACFDARGSFLPILGLFAALPVFLVMASLFVRAPSPTVRCLH